MMTDVRPAPMIDAEAAFVPPELAGGLCVRLAFGRYDALSGRFLTFDDDLDELVRHAEYISKQELYTLRTNA